MNRRVPVYALVGLVLVALNLWRWLPDTSPDQPSDRGEQTPLSVYRGFQVSDFQFGFASGEPGKNAQPKRDLFRAGKTVAEKNPENAPVTALKKKTAAPIVPASKPPELSKRETEIQATREALKTLKLAAVLRKKEGFEGYVLVGDDPLIVRTGDRILGRYLVRQIQLDAMILNDATTNVIEHIPLTGN